LDQINNSNRSFLLLAFAFELFPAQNKEFVGFIIANAIDVDFLQVNERNLLLAFRIPNQQLGIESLLLFLNAQLLNDDGGQELFA